MRLNDPLVTDFEFEGKIYSIDLSFDNVLDVLDCIEDESIWFKFRIETALELLLGEVPEPEHQLNLWIYISENYISSEEDGDIGIEYDLNGDEVPQVKKNQTMDLKQDAEYIFASFLQSYQINLFHQQGKLSWIEFKSLLKGLPQNTIMQQIIQIRMWEPYKGVSKEERHRMANLQEVYKIREEGLGG